MTLSTNYFCEDRTKFNTLPPLVGSNHRRTGQHPFGGGGQTEFCPNGFSGGGGVVAEIFRDPYSVGGGGNSRNFPGSIFLFCGVADFFFPPLTAVTDPKFVLFKHVLCFARMLLLSFAFHDLRFCLSSQLKAASCARCSSEMPPSKQVNGHSFTTCLIVWGSPHSQSGEAI